MFVTGVQTCALPISSVERGGAVPQNAHFTGLRQPPSTPATPSPLPTENRELQPGRPGLVQRQATLGVTGVFPPEELALPLAPLHSIPFPSFKGLGRFEFKVGRSQGQGEDSGEEEAFSTPAPA